MELLGRVLLIANMSVMIAAICMAAWAIKNGETGIVAAMSVSAAACFINILALRG